ncbi:MAG: aminotransferase [Albidovulum sp.]|nr:aminotransferase [Albidovulum sp.]MDE0530952.1 aminotransferase [Albidovulum sp.]
MARVGKVDSRINRRMAGSMAPPVMEARRWLEETPENEQFPLINVSQAAPVAPPPPPLIEAILDAAANESASHVYGPVLGLPDLRQEIAMKWSSSYGGAISVEQVAITSGCNQAFTAAISAVAGAGDAVVLPIPWYFNHKMWLDMMGIESRLLDTGAGLIPCPEKAEAMLSQNVRAIVLVSPNNPTGIEYPADVVDRFFDLASQRGISLILDETYRDFDSRGFAPHSIFAKNNWELNFIHLYSFSKAYRLTGHRVGALIASKKILAQAEKFLDTVSICPNQLGQRAALFGLRHLGEWLAEERREILRRKAEMEKEFQNLPGWSLKGCGAYFAYAEHPFEEDSEKVVRRMIADVGILALPGSMFVPPSMVEIGCKPIRFAFANSDVAGIQELFARLRQF